MSEIHFIRPLWLLAIPIVLWLAWILRKDRTGGQSDWRNIVDLPLFNALFLAEKNRSFVWHWMVVAAIVIAIIAMAGPSFRNDARIVDRQGGVRLILIDISLSMNAHDVSPSRMLRARKLIEQLLKQSVGDRVALIAFAGDAWMVTPLTNDARSVTAMLDVIDSGVAPLQGSRPDMALNLAADVLRRSGLVKAQVFLFTDGFKGTKAIDSAARLRKRGHRVLVMATGTAAGARIPLRRGGYLRNFEGSHVVAKVDEGSLRALAKAGGGAFTWITESPSSLEKWMNPTPVTTATTHAGDNLVLTRRDDGPWLLLPVLVLAGLAFRRGWLLSLPIAVMVLPPPAYAEWPGLWLRADQQTRRAMQHGDYDHALRTAPDADWLGVISYRRGQFENAAMFFTASDTADGHYNRANALVQLGRYEQALRAYDIALSHDPHHADALFNRNLLLEFVDNQQQTNSNAADLNEMDKLGDRETFRRQGQDLERETPDADQANEVDEGPDLTSPDAPRPTEFDRDSQLIAGPQYTERRPMQPADIDQWLRQIPDDPGGWLRRRLEMQQMRYRRDSVEFGDAY